MIITLFHRLWCCQHVMIFIECFFDGSIDLWRIRSSALHKKGVEGNHLVPCFLVHFCGNIFLFQRGDDRGYGLENKGHFRSLLPLQGNIPVQLLT